MTEISDTNLSFDECQNAVVSLNDDRNAVLKTVWGIGLSI